MMAGEPDWSFSNSGPDTLFVWLEPWADEFEVPVLSTVAVQASGLTEQGGIGEIEWGPDGVVVWAAATNLEVFIDGQLQKSASATVPIPDGLTKGMLAVLFADQPSARLGGMPRQAADQASWWERLWHRFRSN